MKRVSWIVLLLVVFSLVLAACGGDEPEATAAAPVAQEEAVAAVEESAPEADPTVAEPAAEEPAAEEPAAEAEDGNAAGAQVALADLELSSLDELSSYRYDMVMEIVTTDEAGQEVTQSIQMVLAVSSDPPATSMSLTAEGQEELEGMGNIEFVQFEDTSYIVMAGMGCMALPADEESAMDADELTEGFTPESLLEDLENVTLVGEETVNGIDTLHYSYDETSLEAEDLVGIESMTGDIYLAKDGGFMVRSVVDIVGNSKYMADMAAEGVQSGVTHIEMNLQNVNEAVEIVIPAACEGQDAAAGSDWPMLADASEVTSFAGILSYTTASAGNDAIDFYNDEMATLGYTLDEAGSFVAEGNGMLTYTNGDGESVSITISEDSDTGLTTVTVLSDLDM